MTFKKTHFVLFLIKDSRELRKHYGKMRAHVRTSKLRAVSFAVESTIT